MTLMVLVSGEIGLCSNKQFIVPYITYILCTLAFILIVKVVELLLLHSLSPRDHDHDYQG